MKVVRGRNWSYGEQDAETGNTDRIGTIININENGYVRVEWGNGQKFSYRASGKFFDLYVYSAPERESNQVRRFFWNFICSSAHTLTTMCSQAKSSLQDHGCSGASSVCTVAPQRFT